ncbi:type II CAAX prenyl endopeptidase Rce1 family protein [Methanobacterium sp. MBAC-LM]|jgi:membrane protease YdiL (CAAX protease family)|uniref:CPBP family glutamic-type intramembrane protease n=1 Tax=Methanobacterium sp. MBAC-LM TaxID=3412034 RepID=UPI003C78F296
MSRITFLDNASGSKNTWWRYILTIILTWPVPMAVTAVIFIPVFIILGLIALATNTPDMSYAVASNPLFELVLTGISAAISILLLYLCIEFIHKRKFISIINTVCRVDWVRILKGAGIWFAILTVGSLIELIIDPSSVKVTFNPSTFILLLLLSLLVFPLQASFEELFFRGYLMQAVGVLTKKPIIPLLVTSVIFAALHFWNGTNTITSVDIVLQVFIIGITLGIITLGENRLETAMGVHIANNIFVSVVVNSASGGFEGLPSILTSYGTPNPVTDVPIFVLYALALIGVVFWNKKDMLLNIFRDTVDVELDKIEVKKI